MGVSKATVNHITGLAEVAFDPNEIGECQTAPLSCSASCPFRPSSVIDTHCRPGHGVVCSFPVSACADRPEAHCDDYRGQWFWG